MSKIDVVLGLQWGDEGKGKIVEYLSSNYDIVARHQGGPNAGHTVFKNGKKYVLHIVPSGIFNQNIECFIGGGCVINLMKLIEEIKSLEEDNINTNNLKIANNAHIILPIHIDRDKNKEKESSNSTKIGTTKQGIGYAYSDKMLRTGLRFEDFVSENWLSKMIESTLCGDKTPNEYFAFMMRRHGKANYEKIREKLKSFCINGFDYIHSALKNNKKILAEGAQGTLLDIDHGDYPFVTSSNTISGGVCTSLGVPPSAIGEIYGVFKAYATRVGNGPFPTEQENELGNKLREIGGEYGATTGRPRRCGWLDLPLLKKAIQLNGVTQLAITKIDVLEKMEEIYICENYDQGLPVYKKFIGKWLVFNPLEYIEYLQKRLEIPITIYSDSPESEGTHTLHGIQSRLDNNLSISS